MQNIMNFKQQSTNKIYIINKYNLLYNFVISINNLYIYIYIIMHIIELNHIAIIFFTY